MFHKDLPEMPCGPILELYGQRKRFFVPFGLKPLLQKMACRVLEEQPENIYEFLAVLMETRLQEKAELAAKKRLFWQKPLWSCDGTSVLSPEQLEMFLDAIQMSFADATRYAILIQKTWRGHLGRKRVREIRRCRRLEQGLKEEEQEEEAEEEEYKEEEEEAVGGDKSRHDSWATSSVPEHIVSKYATVIQKFFRGHKARQKVKEMKSREKLGKGETDVSAISSAPSQNTLNDTDNESYGEEEGDLDTRTYGVESDLDSRTYEAEEEMVGYGTADEEQEESLGEEEADAPPLTPPPSEPGKG